MAARRYGLRVTSLRDLGFPLAVRNLLRTKGITDSDELTALNERELVGLGGFGPKRLAQVKEALDDAGLTLADDEFAPYMCVRDGRLAWDVSLADLFLCDECAAVWQAEAFYDTEPEYVGSALEGYCISCNQRKPVNLRQWFLCGNCERVARSIGRGVAAERYLREQWRDLVLPEAPHLELTQLDEPRLRGRRGGAPPKVAAIDFDVRDTNADDHVFGFELKTGKKYISGSGRPGGKMSEFQLDTTDCDDIRSVMEDRDLLVYLVHVQVIDRAEAPTARYVPLAAWWTDPFSMGSEDGFKRIQQRSRETRDAAYFNTGIFRDFATFAEHIGNGEYEELVERLRDDGVPQLYRR